MCLIKAYLITCTHEPILSQFIIQKYCSRKIDWLFTVLCRLIYGDITIAGEGLQNLGLCSALKAFEQGGIFIVPHLLWHGTSVFPVHPKDRPIQSPLTTHMGMWRIYSNPDPHGEFKEDISEIHVHVLQCKYIIHVQLIHMYIWNIFDDLFQIYIPGTYIALVYMNDDHYNSCIYL
jgi:hypothetical protein